MKPYYYVYRVGYGCPTVKHADLETASAESERLAAQHPGAAFEILQCLGTTRTVTPQTFWMDGVIPPHICSMHRILNETCGICGIPLENAQGQTTAACASKIDQTASSPSSVPPCSHSSETTNQAR